MQKTKYWKVTDERKAAIIDVLNDSFEMEDHSFYVLRAMLEEVEG